MTEQQYADVYANSDTWLGCAIEVDGVPAEAPDFWIPVIDPRLNPTIDELGDNGIRGQMNAVWDQVQGPTYAVFEFKCLAHVDVLPNVLRSVLGSEDTVSGSGPVYTHELSLFPFGQPPAYTWFDFDGFRVRRLRGGVTDRVIVSWRSDGLVQVTVRVYAYPFEVLDLDIEARISTVPAANGWDLLVTIDDVDRTNVVEGNLTFNRKVAVIPTLGQQTPYSLFASGLEVTGETRFLNEDDSELDIFLTNESAAISFDFSNIAPVPTGFTFRTSRCKASVGSEERGPTGLIAAILSLLPLPNADDATVGGASPIKATFRSPQAAAY